MSYYLTAFSILPYYSSLENVSWIIWLLLFQIWGWKNTNCLASIFTVYCAEVVRDKNREEHSESDKGGFRLLVRLQRFPETAERRGHCGKAPTGRIMELSSPPYFYYIRCGPSPAASTRKHIHNSPQKMKYYYCLLLAHFSSHRSRLTYGWETK